MSDITFEIKGKSASSTRLITQARQFTSIVDEPEQLGGTDEGPNPVEYILIGLGGCMNVVVHTIAKEIGIAINNLEISVSGNINVNKFLGISNEERAGYKNININLNFDSEASDEQLKTLLSAVNERCPVKDNLLNPTPVNIILNNE